MPRLLGPIRATKLTSDHHEIGEQTLPAGTVYTVDRQRRIDGVGLVTWLYIDGHPYRTVQLGRQEG